MDATKFPTEFCDMTHVKVPCNISSTLRRIIPYVLQHGFLGLWCLQKMPTSLTIYSSVYCPRLAQSALNAGKCCMIRDLTVWISIPVKPLCSTTTSKCCTLYQKHVCQFNPCSMFFVIHKRHCSTYKLSHIELCSSTE